MTSHSSSIGRRSTAGNIGIYRPSIAGNAEGPAAPAAPADLRASNVANAAVDFGRRFLARPKSVTLNATAVKREANPAWSTVATHSTGADSQPVEVRATAGPDATQVGDAGLNCETETTGRSMRQRSSVAGHGLFQRTSGPALPPSASGQALA